MKFCLNGSQIIKNYFVIKFRNTKSSFKTRTETRIERFVYDCENSRVLAPAARGELCKEFSVLTRLRDYYKILSCSYCRYIISIYTI